MANQGSRQDIERSNEWHTGSAPSAAQDGEGGSRAGRGEATRSGWPAASDGSASASGWRRWRPRYVSRLIGVRDDGNTRTVLRAVGLREILTGVGILTQRRPAGWLWARAGGDVMDLALLGSALKSGPASRPRVAAAASGGGRHHGAGRARR